MKQLLILLFLCILYHVVAGSLRGTHGFNHNFYQQAQRHNISVVHKSRFYKSTKPAKEVLQEIREADAARTRSLARTRNGTGPVALLNAETLGITSGFVHSSGEYFVSMDVGTPPKPYHFAMDTGSDLSWLQCTPCYRCYDQADQFYDPSESTSFQRYPCTSDACSDVHTTIGSKGCDDQENCIYYARYGDGSYSIGVLASENFNGQPLTFGCGRDNEGLFRGFTGYLGMGNGKLSLVSQWNQRKFSYCLVRNPFSGGGDSQGSSELLLGDEAVSSDVPYMYTKLVTNPVKPMFYYARLVDVTVDGIRLQIAPLDIDPQTGDGGFIVDSGTVISYLPAAVYWQLRDTFRSAAERFGLQPAAGSDPLFDTCYFLGDGANVPGIALHFEGLGDEVKIELPTFGYMWSLENDVYCLAFAPTYQRISIFGNFQMQTMRVAYDLEENRIGFAQDQC